MHPVGNTAIYTPDARQTYSKDAKSGDGLAVTLLVVEVATTESRPWTEPADWMFDPATPRKGLPAEPLVGFANANVVRLPPSVSSDDLKAYLTTNGNEPVAPLQKQ
jgi:hypothetical protein